MAAPENAFSRGCHMDRIVLPKLWYFQAIDQLDVSQNYLGEGDGQQVEPVVVY